MGRPHASPLIASSIIHKGWHILYWLIAILDNIGFTFVCIDDTLDYYWLFLMTWTNQVFIHLNKHANPAQTEAEKKDTLHESNVGHTKYTCTLKLVVSNEMLSVLS